MTRQELYELVWSTPMRRLASQYGMSDRGLAKLCARYDVPVPPRGYWAKLRHRKRVGRPKLPPGDLQSSAIPLAQANTTMLEQAQSDPPEVEAQIAYEADPANLITVSATAEPHRLVHTTIQAFESAKRVDERGIVRPRRRHLAIEVGPASIPRATAIMDALIKAIEARGHKVVITADGATVADVLGERIELVLRERIGRKPHVPTPKELQTVARNPAASLPRYDHYPNGQLKLLVGSRQTVYCELADGPKLRVEQQLNQAMAKVIRAAVASRDLRLAREREAAERERRERERAAANLEHRRNLARRNRLERHARQWRKSEILRGFIEAAEARGNAGDQAAREKLADWLDWARTYVDMLNPLSGPLHEFVDGYFEIEPEPEYMTWGRDRKSWFDDTSR